jgi:hypothetical protein
MDFSMREWLKALPLGLGLPVVIGAASVKPEDAASNLAAWAHVFGVEHTPAWLLSPSADAKTIIGALAGGAIYAVVVWPIPEIRRQRQAKAAAAVKPKLHYLTQRDTDVSSAIIRAAHNSAYGRWFAAQILLNSGYPIKERHLLHVMASQVMDKMLDGEIEVKGRRPGELDYEIIPRTYWRSSAFYVREDPISLWRIILCPRGGLRIEPDGTYDASDAAAAERTAQLDYDSLL